MEKYTKREQLIMIQFLKSNDYITSTILSNLLNVSTRTVKKDMKNVEIILKSNGASISTKKHSGYKLEITNIEKFNHFRQGILGDFHNSGTSNLAKEYELKLMLQLLIFEEYPVKAQDICDSLFLSNSILAIKINELKNKLSTLNIKLCSKANGYSIECSELQRRLISLELLKGNYRFEPEEIIRSDFASFFECNNYDFIKHAILSNLFKNKITVYDNTINKIINYFILSQNRINLGHSITTIGIEISNDSHQYLANKCAREIFSNLCNNSIVNDYEILIFSAIIMENETFNLHFYLKHNHHFLYNKAIKITSEIIVLLKRVYSIDFTSFNNFEEHLISFLIPFLCKNTFNVSINLTFNKDILGDAIPKDPLSINFAKTTLYFLTKSYSLIFNINDIHRLLFIFNSMSNFITYPYKKLKICNVVSSQFSISHQKIEEKMKANINKIADYSIISYYEYPFVHNADVMLIDLYPKLSHKLNINTFYFDSTSIQANYGSVLKQALITGYQIDEYVHTLVSLTHIFNEIECTKIENLIDLLAFKYSTNNLKIFHNSYDIINFDSCIMSNEMAFVFIPSFISNNEFLDYYTFNKRLESKSGKSFSCLIVASISMNYYEYKTFGLLLQSICNDAIYLIDLLGSKDIFTVYMKMLLERLYQLDS